MCSCIPRHIPKHLWHAKFFPQPDTYKESFIPTIISVCVILYILQTFYFKKQLYILRSFSFQLISVLKTYKKVLYSQNAYTAKKVHILWMFTKRRFLPALNHPVQQLLWGLRQSAGAPPSVHHAPYLTQKHKTRSWDLLSWWWKFVRVL